MRSKEKKGQIILNESPLFIDTKCYIEKELKKKFNNNLIPNVFFHHRVHSQMAHICEIY